MTHDPGPCLTETLGSLARQDYGSYRVVVVETGETASLASQVDEALPGASVHQLGNQGVTAGFGAAADEVLAGGCAEVAVDEAEYFLFCHDDVVLDSSALTALVETSLDCGADVVGPKLVDWDDPRRLLQMGQTVTPTGAAVPLVERGEIDQGQCDGRREVFSVTGGAMLVRAAAFRRVGGFDEAISFLGDDLSLCWRVRLAGGRVVVTSAARARHREGLRERMGPTDLRRLVLRHRLRLLLTCCGARRRARLVPLLAVMLTLRGLAALCAGRFSDARAALAPFGWNLWHWRSTRIARRQAKRFRRVRDRDIQALQARWSPVRTVSRRPAPRRDGAGLGARRAVLAVGTGHALDQRPRRSSGEWSTAAVTVAVGLVAVLLMGSRHLMTRGVPEIGDLLAFDAAGDLYREWWGGWRQTGLGSDAPVPLLLGALAGLGSLLGGNMDLLRTLLTVGLIPLGALGAFRALRLYGGEARPVAGEPLGSPWAGLGAAVAYAALPLPYTAVVAGDWQTLAVYAAAPWLLARLLAASVGMTRDEGRAAAGATDATDQASGKPERARFGRITLLIRDVVSLGLLGGVLALLVPAAPWLIVIAGLGLAAGGCLAFELRGQARLLLVALGGAGLAMALHLPWTLGALGSGGEMWAWWGLERLPRRLTTDALPVGLDTDPALWAMLGAAAVAVLIGRGWRLSWAIRCWALAGVAYGMVWAAGVGELGLQRLPLPPEEHLLVIAGAGLALAVGCGVAAAQADVAGRFRRLGMKRLLATAAMGALAMACVPTVVGAVDGDWGVPSSDFSSLLSEVDRDVTETPSRVLWVGHPDLVSGDAWRTGEGDLAYATSSAGAYPRVTGLMAGPPDDATRRLEHALDALRRGETARLGRELAPMAVQYIAVPLQAAPFEPVDESRVVPQDVLDGLASQLDLQRVSLDRSLVLYRNLAFLPELTQVLVPGVGDLPPVTDGWPAHLPTAEHLALFEPSATSPALDGAAGARSSQATRRGRLAGDSVLLQSVAASPGWQLSVDGIPAERRSAYGWANSYIVAAPGWGELIYNTPWRHRGLLLAQGALWLAAVVVLLVSQARLTKVAPVVRRGMVEPESRWSTNSPAAVPQWISLPRDDEEYVRLVSGLWDGDDRELPEAQPHPDEVVKVVVADDGREPDRDGHDESEDATSSGYAGVQA